jgi:hypothetical protein
MEERVNGVGQSSSWFCCGSPAEQEEDAEPIRVLDQENQTGASSISNCYGIFGSCFAANAADSSESDEEQEVNAGSGYFGSCSSIFNAIWEPLVSFFSNIAAYVTGWCSPLSEQEIESRAMRGFMQKYGQVDELDREAFIADFRAFPARLIAVIRENALEQHRGDILDGVMEDLAGDALFQKIDEYFQNNPGVLQGILEGLLVHPDEPEDEGAALALVSQFRVKYTAETVEQNQFNADVFMEEFNALPDSLVTAVRQRAIGDNQADIVQRDERGEIDITVAHIDTFLRTHPARLVEILGTLVAEQISSSQESEGESQEI